MKKALSIIVSLTLFASIFSTTSITNAISAPTLNWPSSQALPSFSAPASTLDAVDVASQSYDTQVIATTLQGIVNRSQPRILVFNSKEEGSQSTWPNALGLSYNYTTDLDGLVYKYRSELSGVIIYDSAYMDTINVATTLAGIYGAIVVSPTMASRYSSYLPVIKDLRGGVCGTTNTAIYNWLYNNYRPGNTYGNPSYNTRLIMGLNPGTAPNAGGHVASRDLAAALGSPVVWLDPGNSAQKTCVSQFVTPNTNFDKSATSGNPFFGGWWPNEDNGIRWGTQQGVPTVPSDNFENYSVYSGMSRQIQPPTTPAKPTLQKRIYVSFVISDGDNIGYNEHAMRIGRLWGDSNRGSVPLGWTISPALLDAAPQMLNYYCKSATANDNLICGPNGIGYTRSADWGSVSLNTYWPNTTFATNYAKMTNSYFEKTPLNMVTIWRTMNSTQYGAYTNFSAFPSLLGATVMDQSTLTGDKTLHWTGNTGSQGTYNDVPIMYQGGGSSKKGLSTSEGVGNSNNYDTDVSTNGAVYKNLTANAASFNTSTSTPMFFVMQFSAWGSNVSPTNLKNLMNTINTNFPGKFEFVRPDQLTMLLCEQNGKRFNTALRSTATASSTDSGYSASNAVDGSIAPTNGWKASASGDKWIRFDLGKNFDISRYVLKNAETAYFGNGLNTKDYKIQTSLDGSTWNDADTVSGNTSAIVYRNISTVKARYVRIYITNPGTDGIARIEDFEVYGVNG